MDKAKLIWHLEVSIDAAKSAVADEGVFSPDQISALHTMLDCILTGVGTLPEDIKSQKN